MPDNLIIPLGIYLGLNIVAIFIMLVIIVPAQAGNFSFVNPFVIYDNICVNWFGAIILCIIFNIALPIISIPYWIYKIMTIGRTKRDG